MGDNTTRLIKSGTGLRSPLRFLELLFFMSGMAALAYQVCWQRILFFSFGTDIESTTIIVSVFMMGLGLGALAGGWIADRWPENIIFAFGCAELGIGLFGLASPHLLPWVSDVLILSSRTTLALGNFLLLLLPTVLMGGTLPMLIAYFTRAYNNIGVATGALYCVNTLGAAVGCWLTGSVAFKYIPLNEVIVATACINISIAAMVMTAFRSPT